MFLHIDYAVRVNVVMCKEVKPISCFSKDIKILIFSLFRDRHGVVIQILSIRVG